MKIKHILNSMGKKEFIKQKKSIPKNLCLYKEKNFY